MNIIDKPTSRRLVYGAIEVQFAGNIPIEPNEPHLTLCEYPTGWHYGTAAPDELRFRAHDERDRAILLAHHYDDRVGRFGSWARYHATVAGARALLAELGWTLTDEERSLIDSLEAYGREGRSRQAA